MSFRRMLPFLLLNVLVSAVTVLAVLWWWDGRQPASEPVAEAIVVPTLVAANPGGELAAAGYPVAGEPAGVVEEGAVEASAETDAAASADENPVHTVQAGDTLGRISGQYSVDVDAIMAANGLTNPNLLSVGQQLVIPVLGLAVEETVVEVSAETAAEAADSDVAPTPIPTVAAEIGAADILIADVVGVGDVAAEAVQLVNSGSSAASMQSWLLADAHGNTYIFGTVTLFGEGAGIVIHSAVGQDSATDLYWGETAPIWESGEIVTLRDAEGNTQATFKIP